MADDLFKDVPDIVPPTGTAVVPISAGADEEPVPEIDEAVAETVTVSPDQLPPPEGFTPKEIQGSIFSASVQIYNSRPEDPGFTGQRAAVEDAATLFSLCGNKHVMREIFADITEKHSLPYDVFARAEAEIEGMFQLPSES